MKLRKLSTRFLAMAAVLLAVLAEGTIAMADGVIDSGKRENATLGGGCFWCLEAAFEELQGVHLVESGYAGGNGPTTYKEVCGGETGHAEVVRVTFDPEVISYEELLAMFFTIHDPTTLNRQGADVGTQYRSVIFHESEEQKLTARALMDELKADKVFDKPLTTQLEPLSRFYRAEDYHQNYYRNNPSQGYCQAVINPKLTKFRHKYADKLK
jgi:peptide-methionine (S)-S-oxide reductase